MTRPEWAGEVDARLPVTAQIVLAGNVDDLHLAPLPGTRDVHLRTTVEVLDEVLTTNGYDVVLRWNVASGLSAVREDRPGAAAEVVGSEVWSARAEPSAEVLALLLDRSVRAQHRRVALIVDGAHRISADAEDPAVHRMQVVAHLLSHEAPRIPVRKGERPGIYNTVLWLVDREGDLPPWLIGAPRVRVISVPPATIGLRRRAAERMVNGLPGADLLTPDDRRKVVDKFAEQTEGMRLVDMAAVSPAARDRGIPALDVADAVRFLRSGVQKSPWLELRGVIGEAEHRLNEAVLGQTRAVRHVVDILARAALGLSGAQSSGHPTRPKGVVFLAGPTGVGKTELAKQIAKLVFGREEAMARWDMSEFASEHTEARLIGAPPGYVGHGAGGELTNAVRRNPFQLLLFDEIEKADRLILDKFLQILEDGRLTDGSGGTVHFTESLIVFTSNLGVHRRDKDGHAELLVQPGTPYHEVRDTVRDAIHAAFNDIGRPELLNRIGDNIVVFDFITAEIAQELMARKLPEVAEVVRRESGYEVGFADEAVAALRAEVSKPARLAFGGRAVNTVTESMVVNPLARALLTVKQGGRYTVTRIEEDVDGARLDLREEAR